MIRLIAAIDRSRGIAKHGAIPWYIPDDEKFFTDQTKLYGGHNLIGMATFETFKQPLVDRHNYVLTHDTTPIPGAEVVNDLPAFLERFTDTDLWVVGGAAVFQQVMELGKADELILTKIDAEFRCDRFFPEYEADFELAEGSELHEENGFIYTYNHYIPRSK
jgi:dihydrofolate reductase